MPFVPFQKKSMAAEPDADDARSATAATPSTFSKKAFGKRKARKVAPAQKALMNPGGRSMGGGGR
jgi:hypothetical protein